MASFSGGRSTLNPNAPLYIPAALRQVEDFSPEWWELITTSTWFRDYWLSQHQDSDFFYSNNDNSNYNYNCNNNKVDNNDIVDLLPDDIDLGVDEDLLNMESQFEEFIQSSRVQEQIATPKKGLDSGARAFGFQEPSRVSKFIVEAPKVATKVAEYAGFKVES